MAAKRKPGPHMIIANRLTDGRVLFLGADEAWVQDPQHAISGEGEVLAQMEVIAAAAQARNFVLGAEVVPADVDGLPAHIKQQMQVKGPSVRLDLGYQAGNA